jgi:hypothetical protein
VAAVAAIEVVEEVDVAAHKAVVGDRLSGRRRKTSST